jgi:hypothetical protein
MGPWYLLRVNTVGLLGTMNLGQEYDYADACTICGAGARPVPPILVDLVRMGAKQLDTTAHDGLLIVSRELAGSFESAGLTGFQALAVQGRSGKAHHASFRYLAVSTIWPPMHGSSRYKTEDLCVLCGRAGHFDDPAGTRLVYAAPPPAATDFGLTWEYFGTWRLVARRGRRPVGGAQLVLISERARSVMASLHRRHLDFEPVLILESTG